MNKREIERAVRAARIWPEFVRRREALKAGGMRPMAAWELAAKESLPPAVLAGISFESAEEAERAAVIESTREAERAREQAIIAERREQAIAEESKVEEASTPESTKESEPAVPTTVEKPNRGGLAAALRSARVNWLEDVEWIYQRMGTPANQINPAEAPSPGAFHMLKTLQTSPDSRRDFYKSFVARLLPNRTEVNRAPMMDDGSELRELMAKVEKAETEAEKWASSRRKPAP